MASGGIDPTAIGLREFTVQRYVQALGIFGPGNIAFPLTLNAECAHSISILGECRGRFILRPMANL
jgi:hypothetical protein